MLNNLLMNLKMIMFGGKGGVGKTTCAASSAIWAAEHGRKTLIISTDPAHSLGDSLGMELPPGEIVPVNGVKNLSALEINPQVKVAEIKQFTEINPMEEMGVMGDMMQSMLDGMSGDSENGVALNPPGIDETLAFGKVLEFIETEHNYDLIIFDTAPTGHTLRLLGLPETLSSWIGKILKLRLKLGKIFGKFKKIFGGGSDEQDDSLEVLERMNDAILKAREDLTNPNINSFVIVMIPEEMAIAETGRLLNQLIKYNIPNTNIIVNQLYQDPSELCEFCRSRRNMQQKNIEKIKVIFRDKLRKNLTEVPLFKDEIREYKMLKAFSQYLIN
ncbi:MAG: ArsA family ATPase [Candidatus Hodarchaeota archaeon]